VTVRLVDGNAAAVSQKLRHLQVVGKCSVLAESPVTIRVLSKKEGAPGELARAISEIALAERWRIEELHTEEGRLDEVFRGITRPETKQEDSE
jgi:ABC-2 type transport system ATP-binding protein